MFIFNRPFAAVAGALGVALLMVGIERLSELAEERLDSQAVRVAVGPAVTAAMKPAVPPIQPAVPPMRAAVPPVRAAVNPPQGNFCQRMSSPSRRQMKPETLPSGVRWKNRRSRGCPGTNTTS